MSYPVLFDNKNNCCGCGACKAVCSQKAISLVKDEYGFLYPQIDDDKCINCKMCKSVCGFQNNHNTNMPADVYAAVSTTTDVLKSSSGGVFACIANEFIENGGYVVGSALEKSENKIKVHHIAVNSTNNLEKLLGSKYVQSNTEDIFPIVKKLLDDNNHVLFSGTPCQVASLYSFLGKDYENLFTIDIICHGVPSSAMFNDYLDFLSKKLGEIEYLNFRDKSRGVCFFAKISLKNNKYRYFYSIESSYYSNFKNENIYRDSCYSCRFADKKRIGNITIGDYWGIKTYHPELFDGRHPEFDFEKGISALLINNDKGKELIKTYAHGLSMHKSSLDLLAAENTQLVKPSSPKGNREEILNLYKNEGYDSVDKYYKNALSKKELYTAKFKKVIPYSIILFVRKLKGLVR